MDIQVLIVGATVLWVIYGLQALAFVLVTRATGILNFAQGQILALGPFILLSFAGLFGGSFLPGFLIMLPISGLLGVALYVIILRHLEGAPLWSIVLALFGVGNVINALIHIFWGSEFRFLELPVAVEPIFLPAGFATNSIDSIIVIGGIIIMVLLLALIYLTPIGLRMRASSDNRALAIYAGIDVEAVARVSWLLASLIAAVAGVAVAMRTLVSPGLVEVFLIAFPAVILGGYESIAGAIVGALVLAFALQTGTTYFDGSIALPLAYVVLFVVLLVRPYGFFGTRELTRV